VNGYRCIYARNSIGLVGLRSQDLYCVGEASSPFIVHVTGRSSLLRIEERLRRGLHAVFRLATNVSNGKFTPNCTTDACSGHLFPQAAFSESVHGDRWRRYDRPARPCAKSAVAGCCFLILSSSFLSFPSLSLTSLSRTRLVAFRLFPASSMYDHC